MTDPATPATPEPSETPKDSPFVSGASIEADETTLSRTPGSEGPDGSYTDADGKISDVEHNEPDGEYTDTER